MFQSNNRGPIVNLSPSGIVFMTSELNLEPSNEASINHAELRKESVKSGIWSVHLDSHRYSRVGAMHTQLEPPLQITKGRPKGSRQLLGNLYEYLQ